MARLRRLPLLSNNPNDLAAQLQRFTEWMRDRGFSESTVYDRDHNLREFLHWCDERGVNYATDITTTVIELFQKYLAHRLQDNGEKLSLTTQHNYLVELRAFCKWMARARLVQYNPTADMILPKVPDHLPRNVLTVEEVEQIINATDISKPLGIRDRAMLETLYSTGMRRAELAALAIYDLDPHRKTVLIREGKNRKDRMVPIGERALAWVLKYINEVRPEFIVPPDDGHIFLTRLGRPFVPNGVSETISKVVKASGIAKHASAHTFRHTMATLMLEGGADIRYIQEMLGHSDLKSTEVYTRVSIRALQQVHEQTHPSAKLKRRRLSKPPEEAAKEKKGPGGTSGKTVAITLDNDDEGV